MVVQISFCHYGDEPHIEFMKNFLHLPPAYSAPFYEGYISNGGVAERGGRVTQGKLFLSRSPFHEKAHHLFGGNVV